MCEPTTLAIAATAISAGSQLYQGYVANQQGRYEQQVASNNAKMERDAAADAAARGKREELRKWYEINQTRAMQIAAQAANGFDTSFGSAADIANDTLQLGMQDAQTIRENSNREVRGLLISANNYDAQGQAARARGRNALIGSGLAATGTILGGAGQVVGMRSAAKGATKVQKLTGFNAGKLDPIRTFGGVTFG